MWLHTYIFPSTDYWIFILPFRIWLFKGKIEGWDILTLSFSVQDFYFPSFPPFFLLLPVLFLAMYRFWLHNYLFNLICFLTLEWGSAGWLFFSDFVSVKTVSPSHCQECSWESRLHPVYKDSLKIHKNKYLTNTQKHNSLSFSFLMKLLFFIPQYHHQFFMLMMYVFSPWEKCWS